MPTDLREASQGSAQHGREAGHWRWRLARRPHRTRASFPLGARRLSVEFGSVIDTVNAVRPVVMAIDRSWDVPANPRGRTGRRFRESIRAIRCAD